MKRRILFTISLIILTVCSLYSQVGMSFRTSYLQASRGKFTNDLYVGGNLYVTGSVVADTLYGGSWTDTVSVADTLTVVTNAYIGDSLYVGGNATIESNLTVNPTVADTENPTFAIYSDADTDPTAKSTAKFSINNTGAANPANSYWTIDANDVGLGVKIDGNIGVNTSPAPTSDISATSIKLSSYLSVTSYTLNNTGGFYSGNVYRGSISVGTQTAGGSNPWAYKSGGLTPSAATGGNHTFYIDDTTAVKIDSTRHVVLYSESNTGTLSNAEWYLTQGDQMNFKNASAGYNFDKRLTIGSISDNSVEPLQLRADLDSDGTDVTADTLSITPVGSSDPTDGYYEVKTSQGLGFRFLNSIGVGVLPGSSYDISTGLINSTNFMNGTTGEVKNWNTVKIYNDSTIAAETTLTDVLPAGYAIDKIIFKNTTANAITNLDIGFTDGGGEIVGSGGISASDEGSFTINQIIDDFDAADTIYISASNWNSANLILYIRMVRMF